MFVLLLLLLLLPYQFLFLLASRANSKVIIRLCDTILTHAAALAALPRWSVPFVHGSARRRVNKMATVGCARVVGVRRARPTASYAACR